MALPFNSACCKPYVIALFLFVFINFGCSLDEKLIQLNETNWKDMIQGEWMVEFYAPWCPACKSLETVWYEFAKWSQDLDIQVAQVDVSANPGLSGRFLITALPTVYHVKDGIFRQYHGAREKDEFISFIEDKKWKAIEAIPSWKYPESLQMTSVAYFFRLSMFIRKIHTSLMEDYSIPYWGSYIIFAVITILIGSLLGLLIVCAIDFLFPPKPMPRPVFSPLSARKKEKDENLDDDLIDENDSSTPTAEGVRQRKTQASEEGKKRDKS